MDDETVKVQDVYRRMYDGMIRKDRDILDDVLDESFVLIHMTGMRQGKQQFIHAVLNGTLNYYTADHEHADTEVHGDTASLRGQSRVNAAVFGGGKHTWRLQQDLTLKKKDGRWLITRSQASTY